MAYNNGPLFNSFGSTTCTFSRHNKNPVSMPAPGEVQGMILCIAWGDESITSGRGFIYKL